MIFMDVMETLEQNEIRTEAVDFSFGELLNLHREGEIVIRPEYQRLFRWSNEQRSRLIESILLKLPIPPIFLIEDDNGVLELIDGLQRTSSVLQFLEHGAIGEPALILTGCDILRDLNGMKFEDFSTSIRLGLKRTPIRAIIIKKSGSDFVKYEMFKRLNTGGSLLAPQEIRNCSCRMISGGAEFYSELQALSNHPGFKSATARIPDVEKEQRADEELVLRFFAVQQYREKFAGNVRDWLDNFMEDILFERGGVGIRSGDFNVFFDFIAQKFGDSAFARWKDGVAQGKLAPAYFEAVCGGLFGLHLTLLGTDSTVLGHALAAALEDDRFKGATGPGANSKQKMEERILVVREHFASI
jgi:hypothetical protein